MAPGGSGLEESSSSTDRVLDSSPLLAEMKWKRFRLMHAVRTGLNKWFPQNTVHCSYTVHVCDMYNVMDVTIKLKINLATVWWQEDGGGRVHIQKYCSSLIIENKHWCEEKDGTCYQANDVQFVNVHGGGGNSNPCTDLHVTGCYQMYCMMEKLSMDSVKCKDTTNTYGQPHSHQHQYDKDPLYYGQLTWYQSILCNSDTSITWTLISVSWESLLHLTNNG